MNTRDKIATWVVKAIRYLRIAEIYLLKGTWIFTFVDDRGNELEKYVYENLIVTAGKIAVARRLGNAGTIANEGAITYLAIGTNAATPAVGNTTLGTELARKASVYGGLTGAQVSVRAFWSKSEGNGALKEAGAFGEDASGAADSGTMFNHVNIDVTKDNTKGLQVEVLITVS